MKVSSFNSHSTGKLKWLMVLEILVRVLENHLKCLKRRTCQICLKEQCWRKCNLLVSDCLAQSKIKLITTNFQMTPLPNINVVSVVRWYREEWSLLWVTSSTLSVLCAHTAEDHSRRGNIKQIQETENHTARIVLRNYGVILVTLMQHRVNLGLTVY